VIQLCVERRTKWKTGSSLPPNFGSGSAIREELRCVGAWLLFLPSYSPDPNPIDLPNIRKGLSLLPVRTPDLDDDRQGDAPPAA